MMLVVAGGFTACVNEMPVEGPDGGQPGELSIVFAVGDIQTKAAEGYTYATDKEVQVNDFHVALFDATSNARIGDKDILTSDASSYVTTEENDKKAYQVSFSDISTTEHPSVYAVVIANYKDKSLDFSSCTTFDSYKKVVDETSAFSDTTKLMKVGKSTNTRISVGVANKIVVPLTQLTARIDFKGVTVGDEPTKALATKAGDYEVTEISEFSYKYLTDMEISDDAILNLLKSKIEKEVSEDVTWTPLQSKDNVAYYSDTKTGDLRWKTISSYYKSWEYLSVKGGYFSALYDESKKKVFRNEDVIMEWCTYIDYEVPAYYQQRAILVSKTYTETRTISATKSSLPTKSAGEKQFVVENVIYSGFNTRSDVAIFDNTQIQNGKCVSYAGAEKKHEGNDPFSFYTYERPANGDNPPITLTITGHFTEDGGSTEPPVDPDPDPTTETWQVTEYGYMIQSRGNGWPEGEPTPEELAEEGSSFVLVTKEEQKVESKTQSSSSKPATKANSPSQTYTLALGQYDFIKGNCYSLTGYVKESNLEWVIEKTPWEVKDVNVNFGGNWGK